MSQRGVDSGNIYIPSIIELLEEIERERKKGTSRKKTGDTHNRKPYRHIVFQIHVEKKQEYGGYA